MKNDILMIDKESGKSYEVEKFLEKSEIVISKEIEKGLCFLVLNIKNIKNIKNIYKFMKIC